MLLMLTGSSCAGKTVLARAVADRVERLAVHDSDELGVPANPTAAWRHHNTELWVQRAIEWQADGVDLLLAGQAPLGEVLAVPSAPLLDGIAVCLVDVADRERVRRLRARDPGRWDDAQIDAFVGWGRWHRRHARDPRHRPEVLTAAAADMTWDRWLSWTGSDERWQVDVLDTTTCAPAVAADQLLEWITMQRRALHAGRLPLRRGWHQPRTGCGH